MAALGRLSPTGAARVADLVWLDEIDSTNGEAWRRHEAGQGDGTLVVAERQTGGRGRLGRRWSSPPGNLHLSLLRRMVEPLAQASVMSLLAGVAACQAVTAVTGLRPHLKWPNDLLVGERKLAGILVEAREGWQVVGIGLNANARIDHLAPEVADIATTLCRETGRTWDLHELAAHFLAGFLRLEEEFLRTRVLPVDLYMQYFPYVGACVVVHLAGGELAATIRGVGDDGALLIESEEGIAKRVTSGEVIHVRPR